MFSSKVIRWIFVFSALAVTECFLQNLDYVTENKKQFCPPVCNLMACKMGILTCSEMGLTEVPRELPPKTTKVFLINQDFSKSISLTRYNFTFYSPPNHNISKLTIQNCSLTAIESEALSELQFLETLDLSYNHLEEIKQNTFASLKLKFLRLDGNKKIKLTPLSFQNLEVERLSLIECRLTSLPFVIVKPVVHGLLRLMLSKNYLSSLEPEYGSLFQKLKLFGLEDNRFDCSKCSLHWMMDVMKMRRIQSPDIHDVLYPRCFHPIHLKNKFIDSLSLSDFRCPSPSINKISVVILPNNSAKLTCTASDTQSDVFWSQSVSKDDPITDVTDKRLILSKSVYSSHVVVNRKQNIDVFSCTVTSSIGNSSNTKLQISWPKVTNPPNSFSNSSTSHQWNEPDLKIHKEKTMDSYFFQPQFSLIEMIAGVVGTFIGTLILFILILRCVFYRVHMFAKSSQFREQQTNIAGFKKEKRKRYVTYEPPIYSDSQTYDIPSPCVNQSTLGHFIDFKTQKTLNGEKT